MSFSVSPVTQGLHVYGKWGIAVSNTDAFSVFTDDMLGNSYVISTWTDCCNATAFIRKSAGAGGWVGGGGGGMGGGGKDRVVIVLVVVVVLIAVVVSLMLLVLA